MTNLFKNLFAFRDGAAKVEAVVENLLGQFKSDRLDLYKERKFDEVEDVKCFEESHEGSDVENTLESEAS